MLNTLGCRGGMATAPHYLASQTGLDVLREGGSAAEAAVAMAATLAVVYPHMNSIGGDSFWLVYAPGRPPVAVDGCGTSGGRVTPDLYRAQGLTAIPWRGPLAAITVAGTLAAWQMVLKQGASTGLPLERLLRDAIELADDGIVVTGGQEQVTRAKCTELGGVFGFAAAFLSEGKVFEEGSLVRQPALASCLRRLGTEGLDSFYRGRVAEMVAGDLARAGSPLEQDDLQRYHATQREPLWVDVRGARLFNFPPPTQGLASLLILALFDRLKVRVGERYEHIHGLVEATKQAFLIRDRMIGDPDLAGFDATCLLDPGFLDQLAGRIDARFALPWPAAPSTGDTVWFGVVDRNGCAVSAIQSTYFEYGSGIVLPETGIIWQNRGCAFSLSEDGPNRLRPGAKPFHTLNPAFARFTDGREMVYGTMGGDGQPQTQAAVFSRYAWFGMGLQEAVTAPRWLLGRTWGAASTSLKLEDRFPEVLYTALQAAGHDIERVEPYTSLMGHAGAIVRHPDGALEGACDPRSDGCVAAI
jgi:oxamate amidohydrolase